MSREIKKDGMRILVRRLEPDNLEAQIQALKELQKQPGFVVSKQKPKKKGRGLFKSFRNKWAHISRLFSSNKRKLILISRPCGGDLKKSRDNLVPK